MCLNVVLTPGKPTPRLKFSTGPSVSFEYFCPLCLARVQYSGKKSFCRAPAGRWAHQRYITGEPGKVQGRDRVGIVGGRVGTGPGGSIFGENTFHQETRVTRRGGSHVVKRSSDRRVAHPEVKVQVQDLVRVHHGRARQDPGYKTKVVAMCLNVVLTPG